MPGLAYQSGNFVTTDSLQLSLADWGFVSGATIVDYCRTYRGRLFHGSKHLHRFVQDCASAHIPLTVTTQELLEISQTLARRNYQEFQEDFALVTLATPGLSRKYLPLSRPVPVPSHDASPSNPTLILYPVAVDRTREEQIENAGVSLMAAARPWAFFAEDILDRRVKHRSRLVWWLAQQQLEEHLPRFSQDLSLHVAMLLDQDGVADTSVGSLILYKNNDYFCFPQERVLQSITVEILEELLKTNNQVLRRELIDLRRDNAWEAIYLAGSGIGLARVRQLVFLQAHGTPRVIRLSEHGARDPLMQLWQREIARHMLEGTEETI